MDHVRPESAHDAQQTKERKLQRPSGGGSREDFAADLLILHEFRIVASRDAQAMVKRTIVQTPYDFQDAVLGSALAKETDDMQDSERLCQRAGGGLQANSCGILPVF